jgi:hypothetical protein
MANKENEESAEGTEMLRLMARFVSARLIYGARSTQANKALRDAARYAEAHGERIWNLDEVRAKIETREILAELRRLN